MDFFFFEQANAVQPMTQRPAEETHATTSATRGDNNVIGPYDVICGRDRMAFNNIGNRRMRVFLTLYLPQYLQAPSRTVKSQIIRCVFETIRAAGGRFLKKRKSNNNNHKNSNSSTTNYIEIDDKTARTKCSHAFRDMASSRLLVTRNNQGNAPERSRSRFIISIHQSVAKNQHRRPTTTRTGGASLRAMSSSTSLSTQVSSSSITQVSLSFDSPQSSWRPTTHGCYPQPQHGMPSWRNDETHGGGPNICCTQEEQEQREDKQGSSMSTDPNNSNTNGLFLKNPSSSSSSTSSSSCSSAPSCDDEFFHELFDFIMDKHSNEDTCYNNYYNNNVEEIEQQHRTGCLLTQNHTALLHGTSLSSSTSYDFSEASLDFDKNDEDEKAQNDTTTRMEQQQENVILDDIALFPTTRHTIITNPHKTSANSTHWTWTMAHSTRLLLKMIMTVLPPQ